MRVQWIYYCCLFISCIFIMCTIPNSVIASMDPVEIQQRNEEAPYQVVGKVITDELFRDTTIDKKHPMQIRKMTVQISEVKKSPDEIENNTSAEIFYHYIPLWNENEYVGGSLIDIAVGDDIIVWLYEGDDGWEPVLGGDSIQHITYNENRTEHIKEPYWHMLTSWIADFRNTKPDILVLCGLVVVLIFAFYKGVKKTG